jgi:hypothetical protein
MDADILLFGMLATIALSIGLPILLSMRGTR